MCGIVGYTGRKQAAAIVLEGLKRLEYRGYDSAGIAVVGDGRLEVVKAAGKISALEQVLGSRLPAGRTALAHTRWATHGAPTDVNAHPHSDCGGTLAVVHNGIIENHRTLRAQLAAGGHRIVSDTDTEVLAHLIEQRINGSLEAAVAGALREVHGACAVAVLGGPSALCLKYTNDFNAFVVSFKWFGHFKTGDDQTNSGK